MPKTKKAVIERDDELEALKENLLAEAIETLEQPVVANVATESVPKRYIANLYYEKEPIAKDVYAGSYVYWESTQQITWEALNPQYSTDLELLSESDIIVEKEGQRYLISRWETPKEWVLNMPFAVLGSRYICKDVVELYETE